MYPVVHLARSITVSVGAQLFVASVHGVSFSEINRLSPRETRHIREYHQSSSGLHYVTNNLFVGGFLNNTGVAIGRFNGPRYSGKLYFGVSRDKDCILFTLSKSRIKYSVRRVQFLGNVELNGVIFYSGRVGLLNGTFSELNAFFRL